MYQITILDLNITYYEFILHVFVPKGGPSGHALLLLQCRHSRGHVGLGSSPQSICHNGVGRHDKQVQVLLFL